MAPAGRLTGLGVGVGTGALGVVAHAVAAAIAIVFGEPLVSDPLNLPAFATPLETVASLAIGLSVAAPLLAAVGAFYVVSTDSGDLGMVAAGLLPGGLVYGAGFGFLQWVAFMSSLGSVQPWLRGGLWLGVLFAGFGALGALAGDLLAGHVRPTAESNHAPR